VKRLPGKAGTAERFRFASHLPARIDVQDGNVADAGYTGRGYITCTRMRAGSLREVTFQPAEFPEIKATPEISAAGTRFSQATGGRTGGPFPGRPAPASHQTVPWRRPEPSLSLHRHAEPPAIWQPCWEGRARLQR
jgi:hypothetical protein